MNKLTLSLIVLALLLAGCAAPGAAPAPTPTSLPEMANPASQNCLAQGGTLQIAQRGDGGQYGICFFEDNRQCEEWALYRGDCPVGGLKITGYITPAAQYCVITGGAYAITGSSGADDEQGTCTFKNGAVCDVWDYFNGKCTADTAPAASTLTIQPLSMEVCDGQAQAMVHFLEVLVGDKTTEPIIPTQSEAPLNDPVNNTTGTGCLATVTGTGELYESPGAVVDALEAMLIEQGWTPDPMLAADGPTGTDRGYRKGDQISWAGAIWHPDNSANCPKDQPVSACLLTPAQQIYTITLNSGVEVAGE